MSTLVIVSTQRNEQKLRWLPSRMQPLIRRLAVGSNIPPFGGVSRSAESLLRDLAGKSLLCVLSPWTVGKSYLPLLDIVATMPDTVLLCVGGLSSSDPDSNRRELFQQVMNARGVAERVVVTGYLPSEDVSVLLARSSLYIHLQTAGASFRSTALAAALEHSLPIVAYLGAETDAAFVDGENIRLVTQGDTHLLGAAIRELLANKHLRQRLAVGAHRLWCEQCSWTYIAGEIFRCYSRAISEE